MIAYDGEKTEAEYFRGWSRRLGAAAGVVLQPFYVASGGNVLRAVKEAKRLASSDGDFDELWCVCDVDDTSDGDLRAALMFAEKAGINLCLSTRSFEVWLALHWGHVSTACLTNEREAIELVSRHYAQYSKNEKYIPFVELYPKSETACLNAKWLEEQSVINPGTSVHALIDRLIKLDKRRISRK